jgi:hypothetical protein
MRRLTDAGWEGLHWERYGDQYEAQLVARGEILGTSDLVNKRHVIVKGSTVSGSWSFCLRGHIRLVFDVRETSSNAVAAILYWRRGKGGTFEVLHGSRFELKRGRGKSDPWHFVDERNNEVLRITPKWGKRYRLEIISGADVSISPTGWSLGELDLLVLVSWFALSWGPLVQEQVVRTSPAP